MKKTKFLPLVALLVGLLVSCGGTTTSGSAVAGTSTSTKPTSTATSTKPSTSTHTHTYDETKWEHNDTNHWHPATCEHTNQKGSNAAHAYEEVTAEAKPATCKEEGKKVEVCKVCGYRKETVLPKTAHAWGAASEAVDPEGKTSYTTRTCTTCGAKDLALNALDWTKIDGSNKDSSGATLKFSSNGNYSEYEFEVPADMAGSVTVALYGWVDYWKDGSNNNDQRGFFSRKEGDGANFSLSINDANVEITNHKTYEEMGMTAGENGNGSFTLCEVGPATLAAGAAKVVYTRVESYNLNITEIHFIKAAA